MASSGCVLPLSPTFEDPAGERNYAPEIVSTSPVQGFVLPGTLTVTVTDPNVRDDLYIRWIAEYPPYNAMFTRLLRDDIQVTHSADGTQQQATRPFSNLSCFNLAVGTGSRAHPVTALVADRPFQVPSADPGGDPETSLTKSGDKYALYAEAHWVINVDCP
jgi:hypothetical protein